MLILKKKERNDRILIVGIIVCAVLLTVVFLIKGSGTGTTVVVSVAGEEYGRYSLLEEQVVQIGDTNTLIIHNYQADMLFAECPDQICVKHTPISDTDENIISFTDDESVKGRIYLEGGKIDSIETYWSKSN